MKYFLNIGGAIVLIITIGTMFIKGNNELETLKEGVNKTEAQLAEMKEQVAIFQSDIKHFEELKNELKATQQQLIAQQTQIETANNNSAQSAKATQRVEQQLKGVSDELAILQEKLPKNVTAVQNAGCIPLNSIAFVNGGETYDFCDSTWTLQISSINNVFVYMYADQFQVPYTLRSPDFSQIIPDNCSLELRQIRLNKGEGTKYQVAIRARCQEE